MNVVLRKPMTLQQFLLWEENQECRYEFDGAQPVAIAGGTEAHAAIQRNLLFSLTGRLRGRPCQPYGSDLKVLVAGRVRYPDAFVVCTPIAPNAKLVTEPVVVFEKLSDCSAEEDLVVKCAEYQATPSVQRYVILHQSHAGAMVYARKAGDWVVERLELGGFLQMPELNIELPLAELYIDVELGDEVSG